MSSTSIPTQLLNNLTTASSHLLHHHHHSTSTTTIRLLSTYPRFRSSHRLALPSKPVNTWSTRGAGGRWVHPQPATPTRTRTLSTDMSTGSRTTSKLMTPEDVPLVIPTHPRPTVHNTSADSADLPENPCLNHPEFETGKPQGQDSAPSTSTTKSFMKSNDDGLNWDFGLSSKNKSRTHGSSSSSAAETDQGLSDRELNEMAMRRLGVKGGSGSGSASPVNSTSGSTSTSGSSHTLFPSAQLPSSTSNSSSSTQASASASSPYLEIEQESIGRSTRPLPGSSHSSSSSSASSAIATASAGSTAKPAPAGGIAARKAGRTIGLKGKKNAITLVSGPLLFLPYRSRIIFVCSSLFGIGAARYMIGWKADYFGLSDRDCHG